MDRQIDRWVRLNRWLIFIYVILSNMYSKTIFNFNKYQYPKVFRVSAILHLLPRAFRTFHLLTEMYHESMTWRLRLKQRNEVKEISMASKDKVLTIWLDHNSSPRLLTTIIAFDSSFFIPMELLTSTKNFNTKPLQAENKKDLGKIRQLVLLHNPLNPYYNVSLFCLFCSSSDISFSTTHH